MFLKTSSFTKRKRLSMLVLCVFSAALVLTLTSVSPVAGQTNEALAAQYAPVLHFASGEKFYPVSVEYILSNSVLVDRTTGAIVDSSPTDSTLGNYTSSNLYLDNTKGTLDAIAADYASKEASLGYTAYVHVTSDASGTVIQYWLFYAYNNGPLNNHQGDLEVIEVFLNSAGNPVRLVLSQHGAGENAAWSDVEKVNGHPVVYVAQGSHANYFRSYQGKIGIENDIVNGNGKTINPSDLNLVMLGEYQDHPANQSWLDFSGRWGYWGTDEQVALGEAGPHGPVFNLDGRWAAPDSYKASTFAVNGNYFILAWIVANFLLLFLIYIVARGAWKTWGIVKSYRSGGIKTLKFFKGRGGAGLAIVIVAMAITVAALFLPWYAITGSSATGPLAQNHAPLMTVDGINGVQVNIFVATQNSDASNGFIPLFSAQFPFLIIFLAGIIFLALDIVGITSRRKFARKTWLGIISALLPIIFILIFISILPLFLPFAYGLFPGQSVPPQVADIAHTIASNPIGGTSTTTFQVVGSTTVTWGLQIGALLFIVAAILRLVAGIVLYREPEEPTEAAQEQNPMQTPPPPPASPSAQQ